MVIFLNAFIEPIVMILLLPDSFYSLLSKYAVNPPLIAGKSMKGTWETVEWIMNNIHKISHYIV